MVKQTSGFFEKNKLFFAIILAAFILGIFIYVSVRPIETGRVISEQVSEKSFEGQKMVTKIIDGDTIVVEGNSVRLLGIDADEKGYPCYEAASQRLEELVLNKVVTLEKDAEDKDQYGRFLRYIFLDGQNINLQLVKEGLAIARFYPENVKYKSIIIEAEEEARANKIDCKWGESLPTESTTTYSEWKDLTEDVIGACNAGNYIGEEKIVEGRVADAYKSKTNTLFLNFEKPYPNQCFTAVVFSSDLYKFPENPEAYFEGKIVRVKGEIEEYQGKPEIILKSLEQVEVAG